MEYEKSRHGEFFSNSLVFLMVSPCAPKNVMYEKAMEGIYNTSVSLSTIDEAPMAYKSREDILDVIRESVNVIDVIKPIYNFKAA